VEGRARALRDMAAERVPPDGIRFETEVEVERAGAVTPFTVAPSEVRRLLADDADGTARIVRLRAIAGGVPGPLPVHVADGPRDADVRRLAIDSGPPVAAPINRWPALQVGDRIPGPALVENDATTVLVPDGVEAVVGAFGELRLTDRGSASGQRQEDDV
jgi:hypothetical protein